MYGKCNGHKLRGTHPMSYYFSTPPCGRRRNWTGRPRGCCGRVRTAGTAQTMGSWRCPRLPVLPLHLPPRRSSQIEGLSQPARCATTIARGGYRGLCAWTGTMLATHPGSLAAMASSFAYVEVILSLRKLVLVKESEVLALVLLYLSGRQHRRCWLLFRHGLVRVGAPARYRMHPPSPGPPRSPPTS